MRGGALSAGEITGRLRSNAAMGKRLAGKSRGQSHGTYDRPRSTTGAHRLVRGGAAEKSRRQSRKFPATERRLKRALQPAHIRVASQAHIGADTMAYNGTWRAETRA